MSSSRKVLLRNSRQFIMNLHERTIFSGNGLRHNLSWEKLLHIYQYPLRKQMIKIGSLSGDICLLTAGMPHIINPFIQDSVKTVFRNSATTTTN